MHTYVHAYWCKCAYICVRVCHDLGEPLSQCGRRSSASEDVHFLGGISPISPEISKTKFYNLSKICQTDEEKIKCMDLDGKGAAIYGTQSYNGEFPTSDDVFQHVKGCKEKGKTWWWQCVRVVLV
jgi:hypothetical protein